MNAPLIPPVPRSRMHARALELLPQLHPEDQRKFLKKFKTESPLQAAHSTRELLVGIFLKENGLTPRHEIQLEGKSPDWPAYDNDNNLVAIFDQLTLHQVRELDDEINASLRASQGWVGWMPDSTERLYAKTLDKASKYADLAASLSTPYVVSVFFDVNVAIDSHEVTEALEKAHGGGVFAACPHLSGVLVSSERWGKYAFQYLPNLRTERPFSLRNLEV